jgi:hypothetical protein
MALDLNYNEMNKKFWKLHGMSFGTAAQDQKHVPKAIAFMRSLGVKGDWFHKTGPSIKEPNLAGKGVLTIFLGEGHRHAVAYNNGMISDPGFLYPMNWIEWKRRSKWFYVDGIERLK